MPKLKIKDWKGLYSNIDENEQSLEFARQSINWRHGRGKISFEPRFLSEYELPEIDSAFGAYNWEWETGIYATLTNDPFAISRIGAKYDSLILIAKAEDNGTYHRLIYLKDLTNSSIWYELSKNGNASGVEIENHDGAGLFTNSFFSTDLDAKAFFKTESGRVKLYLPHDCFWIGRLDRKLYLKGTETVVTFTDGWYIDRIVEPFDSENLTITDYDPAPPGTTTVMTGNPRYGTGLGYRWFTTNGPDRRNGIKFTVDIIDDPEAILETRPIILTDNGTSNSVGVFNNSTHYVCKDYTFTVDGDSITNPFNWPGDLPSNQRFYFPFTYPSSLYIVIDKRYFDYFRPTDMSWDAKIAALGTSVAGYETAIRVLKSGGGFLNISGDLCYITEAAFEALSLEWTNTGKIKHVGFDVGPTAWSIVATCVYDDREEMILDYQEGVIDLDPSVTKFAFDVNHIIIPYDFNKRTTRYRFYIKLYDETGQVQLDFDMCQDFDLFDEKNDMMANFYISQSSTQEGAGINLAANIGIAFDEKKPKEHIVITNFRDFITSQGISLGLRFDDYINVYYSALGGGSLLPDLVYSQTILPVYGESVINAITDINDRFAAFTDNTMYLIRVVQEVGLLVFTMTGVLEFGVKDRYDIASIQGGVVINTQHGIYSTTGTQSNLLSEPIDDIVTSYYQFSQIFYNKYKHELYLKLSLSDNLYRFRFKDNVWEMINKF